MYICIGRKEYTRTMYMYQVHLAGTRLRAARPPAFRTAACIRSTFSPALLDFHPTCESAPPILSDTRRSGSATGTPGVRRSGLSPGRIFPALLSVSARRMCRRSLTAEAGLDFGFGVPSTEAFLGPDQSFRTRQPGASSARRRRASWVFSAGIHPCASRGTTAGPPGVIHSSSAPPEGGLQAERPQARLPNAYLSVSCPPSSVAFHPSPVGSCRPRSPVGLRRLHAA